jgi:predicted NAD/FAD-binding protein
MSGTPKKIAIVGSGIAGLGVAHFLDTHSDVTVYEASEKLGGHTATVRVAAPGDSPVSFDTGFMVYNEVTYPNLTRLFAQLKVGTQPTSMSFSVRNAETGLEFSGTSLNHLFAQRKNLLKPSFVKMLWQINRFNSEAIAALNDPKYASMTVEQYVRERDYGQDFLDNYLIPMSGAVWSTEYGKMLEFPAQTLIRFFHNHGFLGLSTQHPWRTITGGSQNYIDKILSTFKGKVMLGDPVHAVERIEDVGAEKVKVLSRSGEKIYDQVVLAAHADQTLQLLAKPTELESRLLSPFAYQANPTLVHTDESVMPKTKLAWSSWNYRMSNRKGTHASTHYWMNSLQGLHTRAQYFVSLNAEDQIDPAKILLKLNYTHPLFSLEAIAAQSELYKLNQQKGGIYYSGSYFKYGFHEDAFTSAVNVSEILLGRSPW